MFLVVVALLCFSALAAYKIFQPEKHEARPPGPPGKFFFGNALQIPKQSPWLKFTEWGRLYGGFVCAKVFSRRLIIINSYELAVELFEKRSAIYADRPKRRMAELSGFNQAMVFKNYGQDVRKGRKLIQAGLSARDLQANYETQMKEARIFAKHLVDEPSKFREHIRGTLTTNLLRFTYGHKVDSENDLLLPLAEEVMNITGKLVSPNRYAVDVLPILNILPEGFPGTRFKTVARQNKETITRLVEIPFRKVSTQVTNGTAEPSFTANHLDGKMDDMGEDTSHLLKWTAMIINAAGVDTSASVIASFFLAMARNPDVQAKAQQELDSVLGSDVLPTFADRGRLPYIECIIKESFRWNPPTPLIARSLRADDIVNNCVVPAGSFIIANVWAYTHDPKIYPEPFEFSPDRFMPNLSDSRPIPPDPRLFVFGLGRRRCPGTELANNLLYITIATTLALFKILPEIDRDGRPIVPDVKYTTTLTSHPAPFQCRIIPRSQEAIKLIAYGSDP